MSLMPTTAMFTMDGAHFFHVVLYPNVVLSSPTPLLRACTIPKAIEPIYDVVALDEIVQMSIAKEETAADRKAEKTNLSEIEAKAN